METEFRIQPGGKIVSDELANACPRFYTFAAEIHGNSWRPERRYSDHRTRPLYEQAEKAPFCVSGRKGKFSFRFSQDDGYYDHRKDSNWAWNFTDPRIFVSGETKQHDNTIEIRGVLYAPVKRGGDGT